MKHVIRFAVLTAAAVLLAGAPALAQPVTETVNVTAQVNAVARLTLGSNAVSFADADPDSFPSITASGGALTVEAKARTTGTGAVTLTVQADGPLTSPDDTIGASAISWTATGALSPGTLSDAAAVSLGSWAGPGNRTGTQTYLLANSWDYATGTYTLTITYTLTAP
jgi:hypothetical protein